MPAGLSSDSADTSAPGGGADAASGIAVTDGAARVISPLDFRRTEPPPGRTGAFGPSIPRDSGLARRSRSVGSACVYVTRLRVRANSSGATKKCASTVRRRRARAAQRVVDSSTVAFQRRQSVVRIFDACARAYERPRTSRGDGGDCDAWRGRSAC